MWDELYNTYYNELLRYACAATGSLPKAEDLVQEVFVKALQNAATLLDLGKSQKRAWLYRALKNLMVDQFRRQQVEDAYTAGLHLDDAVRDEDGYGSAEVQLLLSRLPEPDRSLFRLRYLEGYNASELAQLFHLPPGTVRAKLSRTRTTLKRMISEK